MLKLKPVTKENLIEITDLEMEDDQKGFVEDNLFSIAECYLYKEFIPKGIYDGDVPVGFVLYYFVEGDPDYVFLHRIMVDKNQQGKGYGTEMVAAAVEWAFPYFGLHRLEAYVLEDNYASARLLEKCGFTQEGFCRSNLKVNGKWRDHRLYAKLERDFR